MITPDRHVLRSTVDVLGKRLSQSYTHIVQAKRDHFSHLSKRLPDLSRWLQQKHDDIGLKHRRLQLAMGQILKFLKQSVDKTVVPSPVKMYQHKKDMLSRYDVMSLYQRHIKHLKQHVFLQCALLDQHNVSHILKKGFCIVKYKDKLVDPMTLDGQTVRLGIQSHTGYCDVDGHVRKMSSML
jgi:exonuclease VII large subunit